jgi:hypothetical protein
MNIGRQMMVLTLALRVGTCRPAAQPEPSRSQQVVEQDQEATVVLYGKPIELRRILSGEVTPPLATDFPEAIEAASNAAMGR